MAVAPVQKRADIGICADQVACFIARENSDFVRKVSRVEPLVVVLDIAHVALFNSDVKIAPLQVTLDIVFLYPLSNDVVAGPTQLAEQILNIPAVKLRDVFLTRDTAYYLAAIAAGRTPANTIGFDDAYFVTALRQVQGCRYSSEAGTNDAHVRRLIALQCRVGGCLVNCGGVIGAGMRFWIHR